METKLLTTADEDLKIAARILKDGGNVIFPTETVYGLGADAENAEAVNNIFIAKGRPSDNPLIVHISSAEQLGGIVKEVPPAAKQVMDKFWPGPITIILKKRENIPYETTGGLETVAVRMPSSEVARRLIEYAELPVAAPSANLSGKPSPTIAKHCVDDMKGRVDAIVCGDDCEVGIESTVLDMSGDVPTILRPGGVTVEQLKELLGEVRLADSIKKGEAPKSPGLKYKHYSPEAEVVILSGDIDDVFAYIEKQSENKRAGILLFDEMPKPDKTEVVSLGSIKKPEQAARQLFRALREMDDKGVEIIFAPEIADNNMWSAVRNRLYRAAGEKIIKVSGKKKILFVCTGNTCRSPMAEAIFNKIIGDKPYTAESAGLYADGSTISENSATALNEVGIEVSERKSQQITEDMIREADLILTMSNSHKAALIPLSDKVYTLSEYAGVQGEVIDPFGGNIEVYRQCRDLISDLIEKVIVKL